MHESLVGRSHNQLNEIFTNLGVESKKCNMRSKQLFSAIYSHGNKSIDNITTFSKDFRGKLSHKYLIKRLKVSQLQESKDGTIKWLLETDDKQLIETVFIPDKSRGTLCISSQVGCTLNCTFCHTGTQRLVKNLSVEEIVGQILIAKDHLKEWDKPSEKKILTNIVLMGMGEPLYNYENVKNAMNLVMHPDGIALGKRRITLSTSGIVPLIEKTGNEMGINLAISLHATNNKLRDEIVPINKKYPLEMLLEACKNYPVLSNARRITFEYVMLKGVNDSIGDARELVKLLKNIPSKINLIPFNPWPGTKYECSSKNQIRKFADYINDAGYSSPIRTPRGQDILAACGQLKSASEKVKASILKKKLEKC